MDYLSTRELADKWGLSLRYVQRLLHENRIPGAKKYGVSWLIPADAQKPEDSRRLPAPAQYIPMQPSSVLPRTCPQLILTTFYHSPGSADELTASLAATPEAQTLFAAQLAYFRGETETAQTLAQQLLQTSEHPDIRLGCCFILCLAAMYAGDATAWCDARAKILASPCATAGKEAERDFTLCALDSGLYDKSSFPAWFRRGNFAPLPGDYYPFARFIYLKWLLLAKRDPRLTLLCGPLTSQSNLEGALISEIYCRLYTAVGYHDQGELELAAVELDAAIALALPDRLLSPLAEMRNELGLLLDERLAAADKAAVREMRKLHKRLMIGWAALQEQVRGLTYTLQLTPREQHAAKLAANGLSNGEIAWRMGVSVNSVKRYLSEAMGKTGAASRRELAKIVLIYTGDAEP